MKRVLQSPAFWSAASVICFVLTFWVYWVAALNGHGCLLPANFGGPMALLTAEKQMQLVPCTAIASALAALGAYLSAGPQFRRLMHWLLISITSAVSTASLQASPPSADAIFLAKLGATVLAGTGIALVGLGRIKPTQVASKCRSAASSRWFGPATAVVAGLIYGTSLNSLSVNSLLDLSRQGQHWEPTSIRYTVVSLNSGIGAVPVNFSELTYSSKEVLEQKKALLCWNSERAIDLIPVTCPTYEDLSLRTILACRRAPSPATRRVCEVFKNPSNYNTNSKFQSDVDLALHRTAERPDGTASSASRELWGQQRECWPTGKLSLRLTSNGQPAHNIPCRLVRLSRDQSEVTAARHIQARELGIGPSTEPVWVLTSFYAQSSSDSQGRIEFDRLDGGSYLLQCRLDGTDIGVTVDRPLDHLKLESGQALDLGQINLTVRR